MRFRKAMPLDKLPRACVERLHARIRELQPARLVNTRIG